MGIIKSSKSSGNNQGNSYGQKQKKGKISKAEVVKKPRGKSSTAHVVDAAENGQAVSARQHKKAVRETGGGFSR